MKTLYAHFGSKDRLVEAYLRRRSPTRRDPDRPRGWSTPAAQRCAWRATADCNTNPNPAQRSLRRPSRLQDRVYPRCIRRRPRCRRR
ncbi:MAG: hypothetical protein ACRDS0_16545 [Pseudonocardiaceae bacterium]